MRTINAFPTAEQIVARLTKEAAVNASSHLLRLKLVTNNFEDDLSCYDGIERDFIISIAYSMNETVALINALGAQPILDAIALQNPQAMDWYDTTIKTLHEANVDNEHLAPINEAFTAEWEKVRPSPKPPANAKQMAEAFKGDDLEEGQIDQGVAA